MRGLARYRTPRPAAPRWLPRASIFVLLAPLAAEAADPAATPGYPEPVVQWGVQKDETCEDVAKAVYGSAKHAALVLRYNRVDCTRGKKLKEGATLELPASVTSLPTARLRSLNPDVKSRPPGGSWGPAAAGQPLSSNAGVSTLDTGRADIEFVDRTRVFLASNTLVIIYGTASQSVVAKTPPPSVEVQSGEVKAGLAALRGETVEIAVKGGGRISAESRETLIERKGERTTASVYDGKAAVSSAGKTVQVPLNHASRWVGSAAPSPPRPLPPAPVLDPAPSPFVIASAQGGQIRATWAAVKDAKSYRVELARDDAFRDLVAREEVPADVRAFRAEKIPPGRYFVAVRAIDKEEYLGVAGKRTVDVVALDVGGQSASFDTKEIVANPYAELPLQAGAKTDFAIDDGPFGPMPGTLDLARRAPSRLRFRPQGAEGAYEVAVRYTEVSAAVAAALAKDARTADVEVTFRGLEGIDVAKRVAPVLRVTRGSAPAATIALAAKDGRWLASVPAPAEGEALRIDVVDGRGAILGTGALDHPKAPEKPAAPPQRASGDRPPPVGMTTEIWQPSPITGVPFWSPLAKNTGSAAAQITAGPTGPGVRFQGSVSGALGPFGVDASFRSRTFGNIEGPDQVHDDGAWLGGRLLFARSESGDLQLGGSARVGFPVSSYGPRPRFEPSLALGGVVGAFTYLANAGVRVRLANDGRDTPDAHGFLLFGGTFDPLEWLRVGAALDAHLLHFDGQPAAARAGLSLLAEAGTTVYGAVSVRLTPWEDDGSRFKEGFFSAQLALGLRAR
jgi:hypothetical protein